MRELCALFLVACLFLNSAAFGAVKEDTEQKEVTIGFRIADGTEILFDDCSALDLAVQRGEASSSGDGCLGFTPLHWAAFYYPAKVPDLLNSGAQLEATANSGMTPLHLAVRAGSYDAAKALLESGADANATTNHGLTPLHMLYSPECLSCSGFSGSTLAPEATRQDIASLIVSMGGDLNAKDNSGATPLHYAVMSASGTTEMDELIGLGADPSIREKQGAPVEFYAALKGNTAAAEKAKLLAGDPVGVVDNSGKNKEAWIEAKNLEIKELERFFTPQPITGTQTVSGLRDAYFSAGGTVCTVAIFAIGFATCAGFTGPAAFGCGAAFAVWMYNIDPCGTF